jgi:hypothetical protein
MPFNESLHADTAGRIMTAFYRAYDELGYGFVEKVYCGAPEVVLLLHFGPTPTFKRIYIANEGNRSLEVIG